MIQLDLNKLLLFSGFVETSGWLKILGEMKDPFKKGPSLPLRTILPTSFPTLAQGLSSSQEERTRLSCSRGRDKGPHRRNKSGELLVPEMFPYIWYINGRTTVFLLHEVRIQLNSMKNNRLLLRTTKTLYHVRFIRILRRVSLAKRFHVAVRLFIIISQMTSKGAAKCVTNVLITF